MFTRTVDHEIALALIHHRFAGQLERLAGENFPHLTQWLPWPERCKTEAQFADFIKTSLQDYAEGKSMVCAVLYQDKLVGLASFNAINHALKRVEIGYWLIESAQGKGIITRTGKKLIDIAFNELDMMKVQIAAATGNHRSRAVAERLGGVLEGVITRAEVVNGVTLDHAVYGIYRPM